ncbi:hypothetical protein D3C77_778570 [compost metagenome]
MEFSYAWMDMLLYIINHFLSGQRIRAFLPLILAEIAERAARFAYIGEVQAHVFDKINLFSVLA